MANYKDLHGFHIKHRSGDPANPISGEIWYNTSTRVLKVAPLIGAWSSGENLPQQSAYVACCGPQTAGLIWGSQSPPLSPTYRDEAFTYDGTDWTASPDLGAAKAVTGGVGTQTAALSVGGFFYPGSGGTPPNYRNDTEEYDGSSWSEVADYPVKIMSGGIAGTQTAAVLGGGSSHPAITNATNEYNGSAWTAGENMPSNIQGHRAWGTQTNAIFCGGEDPSSTANTFNYDGTDYTAGNDMNTARQDSGCAQNGTATAGLLFGGGPGTKTNTESWNGTSWTNEAGLGTGRSANGGFGTATAAVNVGGNPFPGGAIATEEYNKAATVRTIDTTST